MFEPPKTDLGERSRSWLPDVEGSFPWLVLFSAAFLVLFLGAWEREVSGTAGFYAALSRQIADTGRWNPIFHGDVPYVLKPPLQLWLAAATMNILGPSSFAATLWPRLFGVGCIGLATALGRALYGRTAGFLAGVILLANGTFLENATTFRMESSLVFGILLALWAYFSPEGRWRQPVYFLAVSFALLSKGAPGLLPLPIALLHAAFSRRLTWPWRREVRPWILWSLLLLLPTAWFLDQYRRYGSWLLAELSADYTKTEMTGLAQRLRHGIALYLAVPFVRWLPFSPLMLWGLCRTAKEALCRACAGHERQRAISLTFTVVLVVFLASLSFKGIHRVRYLAMLLPVFILLGARELSHLAKDRLRSSWVTAFGVVVVVCSLVLAVVRPGLTQDDGSMGIRIIRRIVAQELGPVSIPIAVLEPAGRAVGPYGHQELTRDWAYFYLGRRVRPVQAKKMTTGEDGAQLLLLPRELWPTPPTNLPLHILIETNAMRLAAFDRTLAPAAR